jgi:hypothetical protein
MLWIVKMPHLEKDAIINQSGEKFDMLGSRLNVNYLINSKEHNNNNKIKVRK